MNFDQAFDALIGSEGGYSFNATDPGGETMWGITARVARRNGYPGDMRQLPREIAKAICQSEYWKPSHCDDLPPALRFQVLDAAYNSSPAQAVKWLQRAVGAADDGVIGPATVAAVAAAPPLITGVLLDCARMEFMTDLPTWGSFGRGWAKRIAKNLRILATERA